VAVRADVTDEQFEVRITGFDAVWALRRRLTIPLADIASARVAPRADAVKAVRWRVYGTHLPGVIKAGRWSMRDKSGRAFVLVRRGPEVLEVLTTTERPRLVLVQSDTAHAAAAAISEHLLPPLPLAPEPAPAPAPAVSPPPVGPSLAELHEQITRLTELVATLAADADRTREVALRTEAHVDAVSQELANQFDELSGDLRVVDDVRNEQIRLAQEQARYQIALRNDLAALADELRGTQPKPTVDE
jgi:hypothetical protein